MTDERPPTGPEDPGASTERFRRFASSEPGTPPPSGSTATNARVLILLAGLVVLGIVVYVLLTQL
jgi:hypothetical protein